MATLSKSDIQAKVRQIIDEAALNESESILEADDTQLDDLIEGRAEEALRYIYSVADESLVPWSQLECIGAKNEYPFDGVISSSITIIQQSYSGSSPLKIFFSQVNHCFVASPDSGTPFIENEFYINWSSKGEMYSTPQTGCLYVYTDQNMVKHRYYYNADDETLDGDDSGWQGIYTSVISGMVPPYNVFETSFTFKEVWRWNYISLNSWRQHISPSEAIDKSSPEASTLYDKFSTGTWERPKVLVDYKDDGIVFQLFSMKNTLEYVLLSYVPQPEWFTEDEVDYLTVGDKLVDAFYYYLAGLVCMTLGDERQQGLFQQATELMGKTIETN